MQSNAKSSPQPLTDSSTASFPVREHRASSQGSPRPIVTSVASPSTSPTDQESLPGGNTRSHSMSLKVQVTAPPISYTACSAHEDLERHHIIAQAASPKSNTASNSGSSKTSSIIGLHTRILSWQQKHSIIEHLMQDLATIMQADSRSPRIQMLTYGGSGQGTCNKSHGEQSELSDSGCVPSSSTAGQKRKITSDKVDGNEDLSDEDEPNPKRARASRPGNFRSSRRLACPFFKRKPWKYQQHSRSCTGPGFHTVHRLK